MSLRSLKGKINEITVFLVLCNSLQAPKPSAHIVGAPLEVVHYPVNTGML